MTDEELKEIRERAKFGVSHDVYKLLDEIDRLKNELEVIRNEKKA